LRIELDDCSEGEAQDEQPLDGKILI